MALLGANGLFFHKSIKPHGEESFTTPGTYTWTAPIGVTSVSVVAIGGGGTIGQQNSGASGGGGGLGWKNNIPVTPGQSYTVVVGAGGNPWTGTGAKGGISYFSTSTLVAGLGGTQSIGSGASGEGGVGGGFVGDGGGYGGNGSSFLYQIGGGGAGGYTGDGGRGGNYYFTAYATDGAGGGGAGGYGSYESYISAQGGGGVGIFGQGKNGSVSENGIRNGGSGGASGSIPSGGLYGGAGGGPVGVGAGGAVRIIWGAGRSFPYNASFISIDPQEVEVPFIGRKYSQQIIATSGTGTYTYSVSTGTLPTGLTLNSSTGIISGITTATNTFTFTISVNDWPGFGTSKTYTTQPITPPGHTFFQFPGTYTWTAPIGVTSVSVVAIGGGGGGRAEYLSGGGGGGGGLGWKNNIPVTPGQSYTVVVGAGGSVNENGGNTYFINTSTVMGGGGQATSQWGGNFVGDGGGRGGNGGPPAGGDNMTGGAGGAGGYSGPGGSGESGLAYGPFDGDGGGGGGGGRVGNSGGDAMGGGVGYFGQGENGKSIKTTYLGNAGTPGSWRSGEGAFGGGGAGDAYPGIGANPDPGEGGGLRIVWPGDVRKFPATLVSENAFRFSEVLYSRNEGWRWDQGLGKVTIYGKDVGGRLISLINSGDIYVGQTLSIDYNNSPIFVTFGVITSFDTSMYGNSSWDVYIYVTPVVNLASGNYAMYSGMRFK